MLGLSPPPPQTESVRSIATFLWMASLNNSIIVIIINITFKILLNLKIDCLCTEQRKDSTSSWLSKVDELKDTQMIGRAGKVFRLIRVMRILRVFKVIMDWNDKISRLKTPKAHCGDYSQLVRHFTGLQTLLSTLQQAYQVTSHIFCMLSPFWCLEILRQKVCKIVSQREILIRNCWVFGNLAFGIYSTATL